MMKKLVLTSLLFYFSINTYSEPQQIQSSKKVFLIHKSKRTFIEKKDRPYIKKKAVEQPVKNKSIIDKK